MVHKCEICHKDFSGKDILNKHKSAVHEGLKPFNCSICGISCSWERNLIKHVQNLHEGKKPKNGSFFEDA